MKQKEMDIKLRQIDAVTDGNKQIRQTERETDKTDRQTDGDRRRRQKEADPNS